MYLERIELKNIRGFKSLDFDLSRPDGKFAGWTVFTGDNGAGKSSLLKAIAVGLIGKDTATALQTNFQGWVREGESEGMIKLTIHREENDEYAGGGNTSYSAFQATVVLTANEKSTKLDVDTKGKRPQRTVWSMDSKGWFSCGYGPFRRVFGASSEAMRLMVTDRTARFVTMFQEAASLAEADQWLRTLNYKKLEKKGPESAHLELLLEILRDDLMPNGVTVDRVDSDGLWLRDRDGLRLSWSEMSDGFRSALALLADILRHLIITYPGESIAEPGPDGKLIIIKSGVVMIDEIDAHLHPAWQQKIGFWLKKHFPKIQFLVTTHSPLICQAADKNGLFVLPEPTSGDSPRALKSDEYESVIRSRSDTILLSSAFGLQNTRSPPVVAGRAKYSKLMAKQRAGATLSESETAEQLELSLFIEPSDEL